MFKPRLDPLAVPGRRCTAAVVMRPAAGRLHGVVVGRVSTRYGGTCVRTAISPLLVDAGKRRTIADVERLLDQWLCCVDGDSGVEDDVQYWTPSSCSRALTTTTLSKRAVMVRISSTFGLECCECGKVSPDDLDSAQSESSSSLFHDDTQSTPPSVPSPEPTGALMASLSSGSSTAWSLLLLPVPDTGRFL